MIGNNKDRGNQEGEPSSRSKGDGRGTEEDHREASRRRNFLPGSVDTGQRIVAA